MCMCVWSACICGSLFHVYCHERSGASMRMMCFYGYLDVSNTNTCTYREFTYL